MSTNGMVGLYIETRNYGATAAFWSSLGYHAAFETGHGSGQWAHPRGGPYVFVNEQLDGELATHVILGVEDCRAFAPSREPEYDQDWTPEHWGMMQAVLRDPDGRAVALQAPLPPGVTAPDMDGHHAEKYGDLA